MLENIPGEIYFTRKPEYSHSEHTLLGFSYLEMTSLCCGNDSDVTPLTTTMIEPSFSSLSTAKAYEIKSLGLNGHGKSNEKYARNLYLANL